MTSRPVDPAQMAREAVSAFARGDHGAAEAAARALLRVAPADANAHHVLGAIALAAGDAARALAHLRRADQAAPNNAQILNSLGVALRRSGEAAAARAQFARAGALGLIDGWRNLGNLEADERNLEDAKAAYERALGLAPDDAVAHGRLAHVLVRMNRRDDARRHAELSLARDAQDDMALLALAQAQLGDGQTQEAEHSVQRLLNSPRASATNRAVAWGLVGEARDARGDFPGAFAAFSAANAQLLNLHGQFLEARQLPHHPDGVRRMHAALEAAHGVDVSALRARAPAPGFLVGFPRSGTTLLDQILSSHGGIVCLEEVDLVAQSASRFLRDEAALGRLFTIRESTLRDVRDEYWRRARAACGRDLDGVIFIDKLPLNLVLLPVIWRLFPDAKIIFALRDPRDVILSCLQQRFGMNAAMAQLLDVQSAARYYDLVMRLFEDCRVRLPLDVHIVRYESLVENLENEARSLATFLGAPYSPSMLEYRKTAAARVINTPSARQVVKPLYRASIGRWRNYARELEPALPLLNEWAARWGYVD